MYEEEMLTTVTSDINIELLCYQTCNCAPADVYNEQRNYHSIRYIILYYTILHHIILHYSTVTLYYFTLYIMSYHYNFYKLKLQTHLLLGFKTTDSLKLLDRAFFTLPASFWRLQYCGDLCILTLKFCNLLGEFFRIPESIFS